MDEKPCVHCFETIPAPALKCKFCHEFQHSKDQNPDNKLEIIKELINLIGKTFIPIMVVVLVFSFKPVLEELLSKTHEAEFLGGKFKFAGTSSFSGELSAYELYYLIDSGTHGQDYEGGLNFDVLKESKKGELLAIETLEKKGLITTKITNYEGGNTQIFGKKSLAIFATKKGKSLLKEMGLTF